jgi:hypothetical protein
MTYIENTRTRGIFYFLLICVLILLGFHLWTQKKNNQVVSSDTYLSHLQVGDENTDTDKLVDDELFEVIIVSEESPYSVVDISFPRFTLLSTFENDKIENMYRTFIKEHAQISKDNFTARLNTMSPEEKMQYATGFKKDEKYSAYGNFTVIQANKNYISVLFTYGGYQGGAHGFQAIASLNYDIKKKKQLIIQDLFYEKLNILQFLSEQSRLSLLTRLVPTVEYKKDFKDIYTEPDIEPDYSSILSFEGDVVLDELKPAVQTQNAYSETDINLAQMIYSGTEPMIENFDVFTFTPENVTLYFDEYQVAPYVYGRQEIVIPRTILEKEEN